MSALVCRFLLSAIRVAGFGSSERSLMGTVVRALQARGKITFGCGFEIACSANPYKQSISRPQAQEFGGSRRALTSTRSGIAKRCRVRNPFCRR